MSGAPAAWCGLNVHSYCCSMKFLVNMKDSVHSGSGSWNQSGWRRWLLSCYEHCFGANAPEISSRTALTTVGSIWLSLPGELASHFVVQQQELCREFALGGNKRSSVQTITKLIPVICKLREQDTTPTNIGFWWVHSSNLWIHNTRLHNSVRVFAPAN